MRGAGTPDGARGTEAQPTPLPQVNFTLLGTGPYAGPRSSLPPPPHSCGHAESSAAASDELEALLRQVDANVERTLEVDVRPVRPPWIRRRRRRSIWAGLALYLAVGSASFLWFAERTKRAAPVAEFVLPKPAATAPADALPVVAMLVPRSQPAAQPVSAPAPHARKAERRVAANKKAKRAKLLAARGKRKKRAGTVGQN